MKQQTNSEILTNKLIHYFKDKPEGHYKPCVVRKALGIPASSWSWFAIHQVYPEGSQVSTKLKTLGVTIETVKCPARPPQGNGEVPVSCFVVAPREPNVR